MKFNFAKILLNNKNQYNGHLQFNVSGMTVDEGLALCEYLHKETNGDSSFVCEVWTDKNFSIYQKDFWKDGEHIAGHKDRLILSVEN